jgi:PKD repeat protein
LVPLTVTFTDISFGDIDNWDWGFPGGTPSSATGPGPHTVVYNNAGTFDVSLTVTGPEGTDTETKTGYITALVAPDITVSPASFDVVLPPGGTATQTMTIGNAGGSDLTFSISEAEGTASMVMIFFAIYILRLPDPRRCHGPPAYCSSTWAAIQLKFNLF